jgi:phospholipase/carboxylesterase
MTSCGLPPEEQGRVESQVPDEQLAAAQGRLMARPVKRNTDHPPASPLPTGLQPLGLGGDRDGLVWVPQRYRADHPLPVVLMLHGAGAGAEQALDPFRGLAEVAGFILVAPESRGYSWDVLLGGYGPDVLFINRALAYVFSGYAVDPSRVAIEGFSDGASYALGLGLTNGGLFTQVVAFSPGFVPPVRAQGMPAVFVSHGVGDEVLPITQTSRRIVPQLQNAGYRVRYVEFDAGHVMPTHIAQQASDWLMSNWSAP